MLGFLRRLIPERTQGQRIQVWCVGCKSRQKVQVLRYTPPPKARVIGRCETCQCTTSTFTRREAV